MNASVSAGTPPCARLARLADALAVAVAVSLPWSTSATGILVALWLLSVLPTLDFDSARRDVMAAPGGLPVLLVGLAAFGMLWADVPFLERVWGLVSFFKLLAIPLLLMQFRRSECGLWVLGGFLFSAVALLFVSWALVLLPGLEWRGKQLGIPVKDYISQSAVFTICIFALGDRAVGAWRNARRGEAALSSALAFFFLLDIVFIATSRTSLAVIAVLVVLFGFRRFGRRQLAAFFTAVAVLVAVAWGSSSYLRDRVTHIAQDIRDYRATGVETPVGSRLEFWSRSVEIMRSAPLIGHGTGSIRDMFRRTAIDPAVETASNPHNQMFAVGIQLGVAGVAMLIAMWVAHWRLFFSLGNSGWVGVVVVAQNIVGSLFNSHLFDFTHGWLYVFGVGVAGGMATQRAASLKSSA